MVWNTTNDGWSFLTIASLKPFNVAIASRYRVLLPSVLVVQFTGRLAASKPEHSEIYELEL